jgi:hypothetical protein
MSYLAGVSARTGLLNTLESRERQLCPTPLAENGCIENE